MLNTRKARSSKPCAERSPEYQGRPERSGRPWSFQAGSAFRCAREADACPTCEHDRAVRLCRVPVIQLCCAERLCISAVRSGCAACRRRIGGLAVGLAVGLTVGFACGACRLGLRVEPARCVRSLGFSVRSGTPALPQGVAYQPPPGSKCRLDSRCRVIARRRTVIADRSRP